MPDVFFDSTGSWVVLEGDCRSHELTPDQARMVAAQLYEIADEVETGEAAATVEADRRAELEELQR